MLTPHSAFRYVLPLDLSASGQSSTLEKINLSSLREGVFTAEIQGQIITIQRGRLPHQWHLALPQLDGSRRWQAAFAVPDANTRDIWQIWIEGQTHRVQVSLRPERANSSQKKALSTVRPVIESPMPGRILKVLLKEGDGVEANQPAVVMTSMKMELTLVTPLTGVVKSVLCQADQLVDAQAILMEITPSKGLTE